MKGKTLMNKVGLLAVVMFVSVMALAACGKATTKNTQFLGEWEADYGSVGNTLSGLYSDLTGNDVSMTVTFRSDGTVEGFIGGESFTDGTFTVNDDDTMATVALDDDITMQFTYNEDGTITSEGVIFHKK